MLLQHAQRLQALYTPNSPHCFLGLFFVCFVVRVGFLPTTLLHKGSAALPPRTTRRMGSAKRQPKETTNWAVHPIRYPRPFLYSPRNANCAAWPATNIPAGTTHLGRKIRQKSYGGIWEMRRWMKEIERGVWRCRSRLRPCCCCL